MPWISANLGSVMGDAVAKAQAAVADANKALANLTSQTDSLADSYTSAVNAVTANKTLLDALADSGFYMIPLSPKVGAWNTRLSLAPNEPPNEPPNAGYCAGVAVIVLAANLNAVTDAYGKMKDALKKPVDDAKAFMDALDFSDFEPELPELPEMPEVAAPDWDDAFEADQWSSATLGDVFGGALEGLTTASKDLSKKAKALLSTKNQMAKSAAGLTKGLAKANAFLSDLDSTGVYTVTLPPGAGGYLSRLQAEAGAPPSDAAMYSAGFVCIAVAGGADQLASKYATISSLIGG